MLSTTASKFVVSAVIVLASASGFAGVDKSSPTAVRPHEVPVALDVNSLLVATLANGDIQTQWMPRETCERVEAAVATRDNVAGVSADGTRSPITKANCSTRRIEISSDPVALSSSQIQN
jgi:hypothetical protein